MATPPTASNKDVFGVFENFTEMFIAPDDVISRNLCRNFSEIQGFILSGYLTLSRPY
jgi:hypothetical protein